VDCQEWDEYKFNKLKSQLDINQSIFKIQLKGKSNLKNILFYHTIKKLKLEFKKIIKFYMW